MELRGNSVFQINLFILSVSFIFRDCHGYGKSRGWKTKEVSVDYKTKVSNYTLMIF